MPRENFLSLELETVGRPDLHKALHKHYVCVCLCATNLHEMIRKGVIT